MQSQATEARVSEPGVDANSVIASRFGAQADLAMLSAGVFSVGLSAPLHELDAELPNGYLQAIQVLFDESSFLSRRAYELLASPQPDSPPSAQSTLT
ncbi:hypothetical protein BVH01_10520 [Pseudomonas sp. PA1(2017)]|uniref:hypothetical protein n=1 Tax=Pseudomonas sp. PA1(2017) TaxID=1932113 RepID=UPI00095B67DC|nr:hypothetical protein [Pseudomonas sp. PA1(2017)]OLU16986.1 hypothetical protein BVH01_10520 [Pseudomonas sp. PA1(2017)]